MRPALANLSCRRDRSFVDRGDMLLLVGRRSTRQDKIDIVVSTEVVNYLRPLLGLPEFFPAGRAGMQNDVGPGDFPIAAQRVGFFVRHLWQLQMRGARGSSSGPERPK